MEARGLLQLLIRDIAIRCERKGALTHGGRIRDKGSRGVFKAAGAAENHEIHGCFTGRGVKDAAEGRIQLISIGCHEGLSSYALKMRVVDWDELDKARGGEIP